MADELKQKNVHDKHRQRFRQEIIKNGINSATPEHKVLEYILFHCVPRKDTNELAHALIEKFGSFTAVLEASDYELKSVDGINEAGVTWLKMIIPIFRYYTAKKADHGKKINNTDELGQYILKQYLGHKCEAVSMLSLNAANKITGYNIIAEGDIDCVNVSPRKVLEIALRTSASSIVLAHNHPSGLALPSQEDISATIKIKQFLNNINIKLIDHIIVCDDDYVSLAVSKQFKNIFDR